jgi:hypothetical protein
MTDAHNPLTLKTCAQKNGMSKICVRVVNVFGFEAEVVSSVGVV